MSLRTIMIFPEFDNVGVIDSIREKYDPLARLVRPHITIVFPFELEMTNEELSNILDVRLKGINPFTIELQGFSKSDNAFGNYLFLNMVKGQDVIKYMHKVLYSDEFSCVDSNDEYIPHITVGKLDSIEKLICAYEDVQKIDSKIQTIVNKISVEMIGEQQESIIIIEKELE